MEIEKVVICKRCGTKITLSLSTNLKNGEVDVFGLCPQCNAMIQINILPEKRGKEGVDEKVLEEAEPEISREALDNLFK